MIHHEKRSDYWCGRRYWHCVEGKTFRDRYALRLTDINTPAGLDEDEEFINADLRDFAAMKKVTAGMDAVVHLGGIVGEDAWEPNLDQQYRWDS